MILNIVVRESAAKLKPDNQFSLKFAIIARSWYKGVRRCSDRNNPSGAINPQTKYVSGDRQSSIVSLSSIAPLRRDSATGSLGKNDLHKAERVRDERSFLRVM